MWPVSLRGLALNYLISCPVFVKCRMELPGRVMPWPITKMILKGVLNMGGGGKKASAPAPVVQPAGEYVAPATPPEPEETAMAPVVGDDDSARKERTAKKRGTAALQIPMAVPDTYASGLGIPG